MALFGRGNDLDALIRKIEARGHRGPGERRAMVEELAARADELPLETLLRFLTAGDSDLARVATEQLARRREPGAVDRLLAALVRLPSPRWRPLIGAIHAADSPALPDRLEKLLRSKQAETRHAALEIIAADPHWRRHLPHLKTGLRDEEPALRVRVVQILGQQARDATARDLLRELLHAQDDAVRDAAIEVLARQPHPDLIEDFFDLVPNVPPRLRDEILKGLRRLLAAEGAISERVLERILPLLAADDPKIREAAAQLLASIRDKLHVLRRFFHYAKGIAFWLRDRAFEAVAGVADNITEAVLLLLQDDDLDVVVGAIAMAGRSRDPRLVDGLRRLLARSELGWWVRLPALERLAEFDHPQVTPLLREHLEDPQLCSAALACLGKRAEPQTLPDVLGYLRHERRGMRRTALTALGGFREPRLLGELERVVREDPDRECRMVALEMLDGLGAEGVAAAAALREEFRSREPDASDGLTLTMMRPDTQQ